MWILYQDGHIGILPITADLSEAIPFVVVILKRDLVQHYGGREEDFIKSVLSVVPDNGSVIVAESVYGLMSQDEAVQWEKLGGETL